MQSSNPFLSAMKLHTMKRSWGAKLELSILTLCLRADIANGDRICFLVAGEPGIAQVDWQTQAVAIPFATLKNRRDNVDRLLDRTQWKWNVLASIFSGGSANLKNVELVDHGAVEWVHLAQQNPAYCRSCSSRIKSRVQTYEKCRPHGPRPQQGPWAVMWPS